MRDPRQYECDLNCGDVQSVKEGTVTRFLARDGLQGRREIYHDGFAGMR